MGYVETVVVGIVLVLLGLAVAAHMVAEVVAAECHFSIAAHTEALAAGMGHHAVAGTRLGHHATAGTGQQGGHDGLSHSCSFHLFSLIFLMGAKV